MNLLMWVALVLSAATALNLNTGQDFTKRPETSATSMTAGEFAANATMWQKHQECLEFCHGQCVNGKCVCVQPFCGEYCSRQCQNGGSCNVGPNRCLCAIGWAGEFCEIQEPGAAASASSKTNPAEKTHGKFVLARIVEGGRLPVVQADSSICNKNVGTLELPFPPDIDLAQVVSLQVSCVDTIRRKMFLGINDPTAGPVSYGSAEACKAGTNDLMFDTMVTPRSESTDFRYFVSEGKIVVEKLGLSPELERCVIRASISYFE